jgi:hypothetical protein
MPEGSRTLWLPCCCWHVLVVMTHLAEEGCCAAFLSQFAYTRFRDCIRRTSPPGPHAGFVAAYTYGVAIPN